MEAKIFPRFAQEDQHYTPLCTAFGCVELELNPPFPNPGPATGQENTHPEDDQQTHKQHRVLDIKVHLLNQF